MKKRVRYVKTDNGEEIKEETKVAAVYAVSDGQGNAVPVPYGFWYVGGNFSNGVIISDNESDKYDGQTDKTEYSYTTKLKGNQFVWIPCKTSEYKREAWKSENTELDKTTSKVELLQIEKYGGFYVGRYEAGLASDMIEDISQYNVYNKPQSKANLIPWNFLDWTHAKTNAESMYNKDNVSSGLITEIQWDVILNTMKNKEGLSDSDISDSSNWGNYVNNSIEYTGRKATATNNHGPGDTISKFEPEDGTSIKGVTGVYSENYRGDLLTTGASSVTEKYHIFDMAGNLQEWTEEDSQCTISSQNRVFRGGCLWNTAKKYGVTSRYTASINHYAAAVGFRVVLYIK